MKKNHRHCSAPVGVCRSLAKDYIDSKPTYHHENCYFERRFIQKAELNATEGKFRLCSGLIGPK